MNILIIEDDIYLASQIKLTFLKCGFANRVKHISSHEGYVNESHSVKNYDIILLDINLWKRNQKNGFDILSHIRTLNQDIPVIIISSHSEYSFLEEAFARWAHDYMIKPFRNRELQIRIQRWFRNYILSEYFSINKIVEYEGLIYDLAAYDFSIWWEKIKLSKWSKYILSLFIIYREKLITQKFLAEKIWWYAEADYDKNIRIKIMRLKNQLKKVWIDNWIDTVRWEGYVFNRPKD
jgi:OmpR family two-component system response regulator YxdJ